MLKPLKSYLLPAGILLAGLALSGAVLADATDTTTSAPAVEHHHGHHWGPMPAFARALHEVSLTDTQKNQIHDLLKADHETMKAQFKSLREQHMAFDQAIPGTAEFQNAQANVVQAETAAVQTHVQHEADLHTKIYALLTDAQKSQLATALTQIQAKEAASPDGPPPPND